MENAFALLLDVEEDVSSLVERLANEAKAKEQEQKRNNTRSGNLPPVIRSSSFLIKMIRECMFYLLLYFFGWFLYITGVLSMGF